MRRAVPRHRPPCYVPSGEERDGLPRGVRLLWFRNAEARVLADGADPREQVPEGALVWPPEGAAVPEGAYAGAAAVVAPRGAAEGPRTLPEGRAGVGVLLTVREAVGRALDAVPSGYREGAAREVEASLSEVGL